MFTLLVFHVHPIKDNNWKKTVHALDELNVSLAVSAK